MKVSRLTKVLTISSLFGVTALGMTVLPASASQAAPTTSASLVTSSVTPATAKAAVTITGSPGTYNPSAVSAVSKKFTTCTAKKADLVIANKTKKPKTLTYNGSTFGVLPGKTKAVVCEYGPVGYQFVYGISGSSSTLTVTMS